MSYLLNPSFEDKDAHWRRINLHHAVSFDIRSGTQQIPARSGGYYLAMRSTESGGSIAQDVTVQGINSVSAFAWIRTQVGQVSGSLAIWRLDVNRSVAARFTVGPQWTLVTSTLDLSSAATKKVLRIEFYVDTTHNDLLIDSVNAF